MLEGIPKPVLRHTWKQSFGQRNRVASAKLLRSQQPGNPRGIQNGDEFPRQDKVPSGKRGAKTGNRKAKRRFWRSETSLAPDKQASRSGTSAKSRNRTIPITDGIRHASIIVPVSTASATQQRTAASISGVPNQEPNQESLQGPSASFIRDTTWHNVAAPTVQGALRVSASLAQMPRISDALRHTLCMEAC